jgi:hypothetical protein
VTDRPGDRVEFCGERYDLDRSAPFVIGREGSLVIDEGNLHLHRRFLSVSATDSLWWLTNIGTTLTATVVDESGLMQAWLAPGARLPLVFARSVVWFTAGSTTYDFDVVLEDPPFVPAYGETTEVGESTIGRTALTVHQKRMLLALCESALRRGVRASSAIPTSANAAHRLGWSLKQFNRQLDNVCRKLDGVGIRGLHGGPGQLAVTRRNRLVEYALAARLVSRTDLYLLDEPRTGTATDDIDDEELADEFDGQGDQ